MTSTVPYVRTWEVLMDVISRAMALREDRPPPVILSSLPDLPERRRGRPPVSFIQGPPGRNIALAIGLRAALPDAPLLLIMNADSVTLGTNHLIHAARRNIGMTLLILRSEVTEATERGPLDRMRWGVPGYQQAVETRATPLEWVQALDAALVGRGSLFDLDGLAEVINAAIETPGFSVIGVTAGADLELGILSRTTDWPEYFTAYREWAAAFRQVAAEANARAKEPALPKPARRVPRYEVRIAGVGGQGVKLAGEALSEAAGLAEGLWATHRGEYGSATRGGPSMVDVVISSDPITYPGADRPHVLVVLSQAAADRYAAAIRSGGHLIADSAMVQPVPAGALALPITALAREYAGKPIAAGVVALGCVAALSDVVSLESLRQSVARHVPHGMIEANLAALGAGYAAAQSAVRDF